MKRRRHEFDFDWVENLLGSRVPEEFRELHVTGESETLENLIVDQTDDNGDGLYFYISNWVQQIPTEYQRDQHYNQPRLLLSSDGSGNLCFALAEEQFKTVYQFDHETKQPRSLGIDIPTFIELARKAHLDETEW